MVNSSGFIDSLKNTIPTSLGCQMSSHIRRKKRRQGNKITVFSLIGMVKLLIIRSSELGLFHGDFINCC